MATTVLVALGLFICHAQSQLCGPGLFPGPLGFENGIFGQGPFGPLAQPLPAAPPGIQAPSCGLQNPLAGIQGPSCGIQTPFGIQGNLGGIQIPSCGIQGPSCGIQTPSCGIQNPSCGCGLPNCGVPSCGVQVPSCGVQVPSCGVQGPSCGVQVPSCGVQVPPCGVQAPPCGIQAPIINNVPAFIPNQPCGQCASLSSNQCGQCSQFGPNLASIITPYSSCDYVPQLSPANTVVDNTLANSLANAIQLLIVSNLLESTLTGPCNSISYSPICETVSPYPCSSLIEIVSPDFYPCSPLSCEPAYDAVIAPYVEVPCYQEPVVSYLPCMELSTLPEYNFDCGINSFNSFSSDNCGLVNPYANSFGCSDNCGLVSPFANGFGCDNCGLVNPFANSFGSLDSVFSPVAAEVLFPAEIPAQLTCNFGYMPTNVPCVSVNVEALPHCGCNGLLV